MQANGLSFVLILLPMYTCKQIIPMKPTSFDPFRNLPATQPFFTISYLHTMTQAKLPPWEGLAAGGWAGWAGLGWESLMLAGWLAWLA